MCVDFSEYFVAKKNAVAEKYDKSNIISIIMKYFSRYSNETLTFLPYGDGFICKSTTYAWLSGGILIKSELLKFYFY